MTCSVDGCEGVVLARGWCSKHYSRWRIYGDVNREPSTKQWPASLLDRMEPHESGCVLFTGCLDKQGYGVITVKNRQVRAHRAAYEMFVGPIPHGLILDHECHNADTTCAGGSSCIHRRCVNPDHLAPKSDRENLVASSLTLNGINARKTHCIHGHEFTPENTIVSKSGTRACRECQRKHWRDYQRRRRLLDLVGA